MAKVALRGAKIHRNITCDFLRLVLDSGFRIYVKSCHIFDRLEYTEVLSASSYGRTKVKFEFRSQCMILLWDFVFLSLVFDNGFRIYVKNCHIFDRLEYTEVLSASSYGRTKVKFEFRSQCKILRWDFVF